MSSRTAERAKGVSEAWKREKQLVLGGKGTRDWSEEQQRQIIEKGRAYDDEGKAFEAHHMKSVAEHPEYASDVNNMQLLSYKEHHDGAHGGNTHIPTNGYYDPITGKTIDFGDDPPIPCKIIDLSNPIYKPRINRSQNKESNKHKNVEASNAAERTQSNLGKNGKNAASPKNTKKVTPKTQKNISKMVKNTARKVVNFAKDNPGIVVSTAVLAIKGVYTVATGKKPPKVKSSTVSDIGKKVLKSNVDAEKVAKGVKIVNRASPKLHKVSGYVNSRSGKIVQAYMRGGKK